MLSLVVSERNLKEKLKLREKEEEKISKKVKKKQEKALVRINEIDSEIDSAHYPFEDDFIEMFERKIRKVEDNFEKK